MLRSLFFPTMLNPGIKFSLSGFGCKLLHLLSYLAGPVALLQMPKPSVECLDSKTGKA